MNFTQHLRTVLMVITLPLCSVSVSFSQSAMEFEVPLIVNKALSGDINARIETTDQAGEKTTVVHVPIARLVTLLNDFSDTEQLEQWVGLDIESAYESIETVSLENLRLQGLEISFDPGSLTVTALVRRAGTQSVSVRGSKRPVPEDHFAQSKLASGLSFIIRNRYNHHETQQSDSGFSDMSVDVSGFTSIGGFGGWSLFYEADYQENDDDGEFARKNVTLLHSDFDRGLRYSIGDIRPTVSRFQSSTDMLGISVERDYADINPFRNLRPSGRSSFTLERDSKVSFEVNGTIVATQDLTQGTYSIDDFPLAIGSNDVKVYIDDGTSNVEVANFSTYVDTTLLANGITNFGMNLGVQRKVGTGRGREYESDPAFMGFYEKGVSENLTVGGQIEVAENHALLGSNAIYGTRVGVVAFEAAISKRDDHETGIASVLRYAYQGITESNLFIQSDIQLHYRSENFMSLADTQLRPEEFALNARTSFSRGGTTLTLGGEMRTVNDLDSSKLFVSLSKSFDSFALSLGYQHLETGKQENPSEDRVILSISKRLENSRLRGQYKSANDETRVEWQNQAGRDVGDIRSRVTAISNSDSHNAELDLGYIGSRFELDLRNSTTHNIASNEVTSSNTSVTLGGGVGYADGKVAVGRPFSDGFVIVDRHNNLRGKKVFVTRNSTDGDTVTSTKGLSTVLVPLSGSYRSQSYMFSVDELPLGYDIGAGAVEVFPGNLAGYRYKLGSDSANTVIGQLQNPDGEPISLMSGKLISTDTGNDAQGTIFTNRTGRFVAEKMKLGEYRIQIEGDVPLTGILTVTEGDEPGLVQAGTIVLEEVK